MAEKPMTVDEGKIEYLDLTNRIIALDPRGKHAGRQEVAEDCVITLSTGSKPVAVTLANLAIGDNVRMYRDTTSPSSGQAPKVHTINAYRF